MPVSPSGGSGVQVSSSAPIDDVVASLIQRAAGKDRGFVLSLSDFVPDLGAPAPERPGEAAAGDSPLATLGPRGVAVHVVEQPPTPDEWEPPAKFRMHSVEDVGSFVAYAQKYGTKEKSLVFYDQDGAEIIIDDQVERGDREIVNLSWKYSDDFVAWRELVAGDPLTHKALLDFVLRHSHNLSDVRALEMMRSVKASSVVKFESDVKDTGNNFLLAMTTTKGEELQAFPKEISLGLPVLDEDVLEPSQFAGVKIRIEVIMPDRADKQVTFALLSNELDAAARRRVSKAFEEVRESLEGWTICRGASNYSARSIGVPKR